MARPLVLTTVWMTVDMRLGALWTTASLLAGSSARGITIKMTCDDAGPRLCEKEQRAFGGASRLERQKCNIVPAVKHEATKLESGALGAETTDFLPRFGATDGRGNEVMFMKKRATRCDERRWKRVLLRTLSKITGKKQEHPTYPLARGEPETMGPPVADRHDQSRPGPAPDWLSQHVLSQVD